MKVWVFVEGEGDCKALGALFADWRERLRKAGWGLPIIALGSKSLLLRKIGWHAAEKLCADPNDLVVGLPDLYPNRGYETTEYRHASFDELRQIQTKRVLAALRDSSGLNSCAATTHAERFFGSAMKHDLEVLLLAAPAELRAYLRTRDHLGTWRNPVEEQNQNNPPKHIVEGLFKAKLKRAYRDTKDAPAVLRTVPDVRTILYGGSQQIQCPAFKEMLDWVGRRTGVSAY
jgi:hypothetical protein